MRYAQPESAPMACLPKGETRYAFISLMLFSLLCCRYQTVYANFGRARIDSLKTELKQAKTDTAKARLNYLVAKSYLNYIPQDGLPYAFKALGYARSEHNKIKIIEAYNVIAVLYLNFTETDIANAYIDSANRLLPQVRDAMSEAQTCLNRGYLMFRMGKQLPAQENYLKSIQIAEKYDLMEILINAYQNMASLYIVQQDGNQAKKYLDLVFEYAGRIHDSDQLVNGLGNLGIWYIDRADTLNSLKYYKETITIGRRIDQYTATIATINNLGNLYGELGNHREARYYLNEGVKLAELTKQDMLLVFLFLNLGWDHILSGDYETARLYSEKSLVLALRDHDLNNIQENYENLAIIDSAEGQWKSSLANYKLFILYRDSLFNIENSKQIALHQMQFDFDKQETIAKAERERKAVRQRMIRNSIAAGLGISLLFLFMVFRQRNRISKEKRKSEELLLNILPSEVADELKETGTAMAKKFQSVTVLFTDFKGFSIISSAMSPEDLVAEINACFSAFDTICQQYKLEKIKTIGDSYMCAGGLPVPSETHAIDVVNAAIDMRNFIDKRIKDKIVKGETPFEIRIGVHTGPVVAGIVGIKKFAYDIWGDTVNIASRMESSGQAGKVNISGATYALVHDAFSCTYRGKVPAKNIGEVDMYFVERKT